MPDFVERPSRPTIRPDWSRHPTGMDALGGADPFIMEPDGRCQLFVPSGLKDGPLPTHYEPVESPVANPLYPASRSIRRRSSGRGPATSCTTPQDPRFPYVFTTYPPDRAALRRHRHAA